MKRGETSIDEILSTYFESEYSRLVGVRQRRARGVEHDLRRYLEHHGERVLSSVDAVLLHAERQFNPQTAFVTTMDAEDLLFAFPGFLAQPWTPAQRLQRKAQLDHVDGLLSHMMIHRQVGYEGQECAFLDVRGALDNGRSDLARLHAREKPRPTRLPGE
jgi:hypothetical protein